MDPFGEEEEKRGESFGDLQGIGILIGLVYTGEAREAFTTTNWSEGKIRRRKSRSKLLRARRNKARALSLSLSLAGNFQRVNLRCCCLIPKENLDENERERGQQSERGRQQVKIL